MNAYTLAHEDVIYEEEAQPDTLQYSDDIAILGDDWSFVAE